MTNFVNNFLQLLVKLSIQQIMQPPWIPDTKDLEAQVPHKPWSVRNFKIVKKLGEGSYGEVFLAKTFKSNSKVALKVIGPVEHYQPNDQVMREIRIQMSLRRHPSILRLYGAFLEGEYIFLILEYACGGNLFTKLQKEGHFTEKQAATYISSLSQALDYCHSKCVIHRDIKPENLLLDHEGRLKIADFGSSVKSKSSMKRKKMYGTLPYMAPEMVENSKYDHTVDIWALGILCYELLYGHPPFESEERIKKIDLSFPDTPKVSSEAKKLITQLLVKDPSKRLSILKIMQDPWIVKNAYPKGLEAKPRA